MGVERSVTRWHAQRQLIQYDIATLEGRLALCASEARPLEEGVEIEQKLAEAQARLHALGPCPKPMMG